MSRQSTRQGGRRRILALGRRATTRGLMIAAPAPQAPVVHPRLSGGALFASDMDG